MHSFGVADLEAHQQTDRFDGVVAAVHVIPHEEVIGVRSRAAYAVQFHQVVPLAVDVAADRHGRRDGLHVGLQRQRFARFVAELLNFGFGERGAVGQFGQPDFQIGVGAAGGCRGGGWRRWGGGGFGHGGWVMVIEFSGLADVRSPI